jgi:hypothetical protein
VSSAKVVSYWPRFRQTAAGEVNARHCSGIQRVKSFPFGGAGENQWRIEASEDKALSLSSGSGSTVTGKLAANQTTTPNPSIEGMPKRLRLLVTPHVKR